MTKVYYNNQVYTANTLAADAMGANSVLFKNTGTDTVYIDDNIELLAGQSFEFNNDPGQIIEHTFKITFAAVATKKLLMVRKFAK